MFNQVGKCPGHSHCGLITYVHDLFNTEELHIDQITTGWEHLTLEVSHNTQNAKKYIISNIYRPPERYVIFTIYRHNTRFETITFYLW